MFLPVIRSLQTRVFASQILGISLYLLRACALSLALCLIHNPRIVIMVLLPSDAYVHTVSTNACGFVYVCWVDQQAMWTYRVTT